MVPKILSIAGFDGSCGAGMQADLKTFTAFGCYGFTVLTALPVQNTTGVKAIYNIPIQAIEEQIKAIFEDTSIDAIKIGMLFNKEIIQLVAELLKYYAPNIPIVVDPVMISKSGHKLLLPEAIKSLKEKILPISRIITPNLPEASALIGKKIETKEEMILAAEQLLRDMRLQSVLLKGGHLLGQEMDDLFLEKQINPIWLRAPRVETNNTHGTGCTLSAAIASCLGLGLDLQTSCTLAKQYLFQALSQADNLNIGKGHGPVHHFYHLWPTIDKI